MLSEFDYTTSARRFWAKFPALAYLSIQISFWVAANILLGFIMHLRGLQINEIVKQPGLTQGAVTIKVAVIFGILYAVVFGLTAYYLEKTFYKKKSLGQILLFNTAMSVAVLILLLTFVRLIMIDLLMSDYVKTYPLNEKSWEYFFAIVVVYYFFMTLVINFINEVNKKYGPGVLLPLMLGKYRDPREEERIFMFMDLKASTTHAEKLGHLRYSSFIRDSFMDINNVVSAYDAEIYQYVGDEIVLSWKIRHGITNASCVRFYFACEEEFNRRSSYYLELYGMLPSFKAGVHGGKITAVEIGIVKKDIAYHGDVLNTSSRIQGLCNEYNQQLIISTELLEKIRLPHNLLATKLGDVSLKGKVGLTGVAGISKRATTLVDTH